MYNSNIIKTFHLRAARSVLGIGVRELGVCLGVSGATISLWENKSIAENLNKSDHYMVLIRKFFEQRSVFFPDDNSISMNPLLIKNNNNSLTRFQIRAGRAVLNLSQPELSHSTGIAVQIIARAECLSNHQFIRPRDKDITYKLRDWFQLNGIVFLNDLSLSFLPNQNLLDYNTSRC